MAFIGWPTQACLIVPMPSASWTHPPSDWQGALPLRLSVTDEEYQKVKTAMPRPDRYPEAVIFLDIDGVLCHHAGEGMMSRDPDTHMHNFDRDSVAQLNRILDAVKCEIVVSSTWRIMEEYPELRRHFFNQGVKQFISGVTPDNAQVQDRTPSGLWVSAGTRGDEIKTYLGWHDHIKRYVILDDSSDMLKEQADRFVYVENGMFNGGLLETHADQAIKILELNC